MEAGPFLLYKHCPHCSPVACVANLVGPLDEQTATGHGRWQSSYFSRLRLTRVVFWFFGYNL
jgi:hypothetical protein